MKKEYSTRKDAIKMRRFYKRHPARVMLLSAGTFARKKGYAPPNVTEEELTEMLADPNRVCICGSKTNLTLDHCHKTGKFRGWLCRAHNSAMGAFNDDPSLLRAFADYLEKEDKSCIQLLAF